MRRMEDSSYSTFKAIMNQGYSSDTCHSYVEGVSTSYGYVPSLPAAATFVALFGLSMIVHSAQLAFKRTWWCLVFPTGCLGEFN